MLFAAKISKDWYWQSLWWLVVTAIAVFLKYYYSVAETDDLEWIFHPLAILLEFLTGYGFEHNHDGEWASYSANVRLVKACAGMNFMIMSFLIYSWVFRPDDKADRLSNILGQLLLLFAAIISAWLTCLIANSFRIVIAMYAVPEDISQNSGLPLFGMSAEQLHRLIGMLVYIPFLSLQVALDHRLIKKYRNVIFVIPLFLYMLFTVLIPLLTGNALKTPDRFVEHMLSLFSMAVFIVVILVLKNFLSKAMPQSKKYKHNDIRIK